MIMVTQQERYIDAVYADDGKRKMLEYVEEKLRPVDKLSKSGRVYPFRSRFGHTIRVIEWALRIQAVEKGDAEIITVAGIFHDVGYVEGGAGHAKASECMFLEYVAGQEQTQENAQMWHQPEHVQWRRAVAETIRTHSNKDWDNSLLTTEQQILMDADLLDEAGAMSVLWSCFAAAGRETFNFESTFEEIQQVFEKLQKDATLFHTECGRALNRQMQAGVGEFARVLKYELNLK